MVKQIRVRVVPVVIVARIVMDITPDLEQLVVAEVAHQPLHKIITLLLKLEELVLLGQDQVQWHLIINPNLQSN